MMIVFEKVGIMDKLKVKWGVNFLKFRIFLVVVVNGFDFVINGYNMVVNLMVVN